MNKYIMTKEESLRINILKFIAIIFVVYIHSYATKVQFSEGTAYLMLSLFEMLVSKTVASCGVPLFFIISAMLLFMRRRNYKKTIIRKVRTLLFPYIIWNTLWILAFILLQNIPFTSTYFSGNKTPILKCTILEWFKLYGIGIEYPINYPLWFMRDLMIVTIMYPIINKLANRFPRQLLLIVATLLVIPIDFPLKQALLWFSIGACIVKMQIHIAIFDNIALWKIMIIYVVGTVFAMIMNNSIISVFYIFLGLIFWIRLSKNIVQNTRMRELILKLSEWTFIIYVAHELTLSSMKKVCAGLLPTTPIWLFVQYLFLPVIVIFGCIFIGRILKEKVPKIYNICTGNR